MVPRAMDVGPQGRLPYEVSMRCRSGEAARLVPRARNRRPEINSISMVSAREVLVIGEQVALRGAQHLRRPAPWQRPPARLPLPCATARTNGERCNPRLPADTSLRPRDSCVLRPPKPRRSPPRQARLSPPAVRWPGGGAQLKLGPTVVPPCTVQHKAASAQSQPHARQPPPPPVRQPRPSAVLQRKKVRPDLAALRSAVRGQVSKTPGECLAQTTGARKILAAYVDTPATELRAALLEWIEDDGEDRGNHVASYVRWSDGDYVVDTTWKQFDAPVGGDDVLVRPLDEWQRLILSKQKAAVTSPHVQILDRPPSDSGMAMRAAEYVAEYRESKRTSGSAAKSSSSSTKSAKQLPGGAIM
jgi:hypothetical protein